MSRISSLNFGAIFLDSTHTHSINYISIIIIAHTFVTRYAPTLKYINKFLILLVPFLRLDDIRGATLFKKVPADTLAGPPPQIFQKGILPQTLRLPVIFPEIINWRILYLQFLLYI